MAQGAILIIEDNKDIRVPISIMLGKEGFDVFEAEDCKTAFDYLAEKQPDVILTDLLMPEMTGLEFIRQIRRTSGLIDVPIIAMSAYDTSYLAAAVLAGANAALHKPEDMDRLVETVKEVLRYADHTQERLQYAGNGGGRD
jgi:CheY-like chemotaxis protein